MIISPRQHLSNPLNERLFCINTTYSTFLSTYEASGDILSAFPNTTIIK